MTQPEDLKIHGPEVYGGLLEAKSNGVAPLDNCFFYVPGLRMFGNPGPLLSALASAQAEFEPIVRTRKNPFFNSVYADLSDVLAACMPALNKHGLSLNQLPTRPDNAGNWTVYTILGHKSGSFWMLESVIPAAEWQKFGSALTYNRRYTDSAVLGVASEPDDDGNAADSKGEEKSGPRQGTRPTPPPVQQKAAPPKAATKDDPEFLSADHARAAVKDSGGADQVGVGKEGSAPVATAMAPEPAPAPPLASGESASSPKPAAEASRPLNDLLKDIGDALRVGRLRVTKDGETKWFTKAEADVMCKATIGKATTAISTVVEAVTFLTELGKLPETTAKQKEARAKLQAKFGKDREQADLFCADIIGHQSDWVPSDPECDELLEALNR